jgi:polyhydroxyalkanoate synthesis regulator phasin
MAETAPKDNQLVTRRLLNSALRGAAVAVVQEVADPLQKRLEALEKRIAALEDKPS